MLDNRYEIRQEDDLFRRVKLPVPPNSNNDYIKVLEDGSKEVTRLAFRPDPNRDTDGLSINIVKLSTSIKSIYPTKTHTGVFIKAEIPIQLGCPCVHDPLPNDNSHGLIQGLMNERAKQVKLAIACRLI